LGVKGEYQKRKSFLNVWWGKEGGESKKEGGAKCRRQEAKKM